MSTPRHAQIVGGPRDGEIVPWHGMEMFEPVALTCRWLGSEDALPPSSSSYMTRRYCAYQWNDRTWRYVADEYAKGLGCP